MPKKQDFLREEPGGGNRNTMSVEQHAAPADLGSARPQEVPVRAHPVENWIVVADCGVGADGVDTPTLCVDLV
jgi:hypothetical protein